MANDQNNTKGTATVVRLGKIALNICPVQQTWFNGWRYHHVNEMFQPFLPVTLKL